MSTVLLRSVAVGWSLWATEFFSQASRIPIQAQVVPPVADSMRALLIASVSITPPVHFLVIQVLLSLCWRPAMLHVHPGHRLSILPVLHHLMTQIPVRKIWVTLSLCLQPRCVSELWGPQSADSWTWFWEFSSWYTGMGFGWTSFNLECTPALDTGSTWELISFSELWQQPKLNPSNWFVPTQKLEAV